MTLPALPYNCYSYRFDGDFTLNDGRDLKLALSSDESSSVEGTGQFIWDASVVMVRWIDTQQSFIGHKNENRVRILELGAGKSGLCGLVCALKEFGDVVLSDLTYCIDTLNENIRVNNSALGSIHAAELDWIDPEKFSLTNPQPFDVILGADIVWLKELVTPLVNTFSHFTKLNKRINIFLAHQTRSTIVDDLFFKEMKDAGFAREIIHQEGVVKIYCFTFHGCQELY